jgi:predicted RNA-binding protein with RPS1 domain
MSDEARIETPQNIQPPKTPEELTASKQAPAELTHQQPPPSVAQETPPPSPPASASGQQGVTPGEQAVTTAAAESPASIPATGAESTPVASQEATVTESPVAQVSRPPQRSLAAAAATAEEREALKRAELEALDEEIEAELQAALAEVEKVQTAEATPPPVQPKPKRAQQEPATRKGVILAVVGSDVFVDIGGRTQGVLPLEQFRDAPPRPGQEIEVAICGYDQENGLVLLERPGVALAKASWAAIKVGAVVEARVTGVVKSGLEVDVGGIRGFIPASHVDVHRVEDLSPYVGQRFLCEVIEANPEEDTLVLSRRAVLEKERQQAQEQLWQELAEGQIRTGVVRSVQDYGAFVDLGHGVEGLLHVSEMSWSRRVQPSELLQPGQEVRVAIIKLDRQNKKIGLSLKQVQGSPWDTVEDKYPVGTVVTGKVVRLAEYGAFVELEPGVEGLVHISELSPQRVRRVEDVVKIGDEVRAQVIKVDRVARRISLSLKAVQVAEEEELAPRWAESRRGPATSTRRRPLKGGLD